MNTGRSLSYGGVFSDVQIPLWSMNTGDKDIKKKKLLRSDSSMVDEYQGLSETEIAERSSDSSMVDEYECKTTSAYGKDQVQIPLWSMNTHLGGYGTAYTISFRFLYGR